jgi:hypothetical protein
MVRQSDPRKYLVVRSRGRVDDRSTRWLSAAWCLAMADIQIQAVGANERQSWLWVRLFATARQQTHSRSLGNQELAATTADTMSSGSCTEEMEAPVQMIPWPRRTNRWTRAAGALLATCLVRRKVIEFAPPRQLNRSVAPPCISDRNGGHLFFAARIALRP